MGKRIVILTLFFFFIFVGTGLAKEIEVGEGQTYKTISAALEVSEDGDIITVYPGLYEEKLTIQKSVTLRSLDPHEATIQGDYKDYVITVQSPDVTIDGFKIIGSGNNFLKNDAGILIDQVNDVDIHNNVMEDVLFGIYLDSSAGTLITNNKITGFEAKRLSERGNGIHFYNTNGIKVYGNEITRVRDGMYFDHAVNTIVEENQITNVRYGLHYMWSNDNIFRKNYFSESVSGAAIMYSKRINLDNNVFQNNRGHRAYGMFFQTAEESIVENNFFFNNSNAIYSDLSRGNIIRNNILLQNDIGIEMLGSNWDNEIYENAFLENLQQATVNEIEINDQWFKNYWSDYSGIDVDKDGIGDRAYRSGSLFEYLMYQYPHFRLFVESPTAKMLQTVDQMFPVVERAEIVDEHPLMSEKMIKTDFSATKTTEKDGVASIVTFISSLFLVFVSIFSFFYITKRFSKS